MKKTIVITLAVCIGIISANAQTSTSAVAANGKYVAAMEKNLQLLDSANTPENLMALANTFERIGNAETNQWHPYYYAAYCYTLLAYMSPDKRKVDGLADKADDFLNKAAVISSGNSEISCLSAMLTYSRLQVDPMNRWQAMGAEAAAYLAKAKKEDPSNPRIYLIEARAKMGTPENLGGGPKGAAPVVALAVQKYNSFVPAGTLAPRWGKQVAEKMLAKLNGQQ
jgi:hypothetical protein